MHSVTYHGGRLCRIVRLSTRGLKTDRVEFGMLVVGLGFHFFLPVRVRLLSGHVMLDLPLGLHPWLGTVIGGRDNYAVDE